MAQATAPTVPSAQKRTHCPICGAKIVRSELSICAYCASPLDLLDKRRPADDDSQKRLEKIRNHPEFGEAMSFEPHDGGTLLAAQTRLKAAVWQALVALGLALGLWFLARGADTRPAPWSFLPLGLLVFWSLVSGRKALSTAAEIRSRRSLPLLRRPALVRDRRSRTGVSTWAWRAQTSYYFQLALEDGIEAEFLFPGRGGDHELLVPGNTGVAYTRGAELIDFRKIKV